MGYNIRVKTVQDLIDELSQVVDKTKNVYLAVGEGHLEPLRLAVDDFQLCTPRFKDEWQILLLSDQELPDRTEEQEKNFRKDLEDYRKMERRWQREEQNGDT